MVGQPELVQIYASFAANLGQLVNGICFSLSAYSVPQILRGDGGIQMTEDQSSWFASLLALGSLTGSLQGGYVCEKFGRRKSMMLDCLGYILGFLLIGLGPNVPLVLLGRFLTGHFAGSNLMCTPIFVGETSHPSIRGLTATLMTILFCSGFTLSMFLGAVFPWRTVTCLATIPPALSFILLMTVKESPTWLMRQGRGEDAHASLFFYRRDHEASSEELEKIKDNIWRIQKQREAYGTSWIGQLKGKLRRMRESSFLKPFILLNIMLNIGLEWGGFPSLAFYMHTILEEVKVPFDTYWVAVFLSAYRTVVSISLSFILVKVPRRPMYLFSGSLVSVALAIQATYAWFHTFIPEEYTSVMRWTPLLAIIIQYTGFGLGYGIIIYNLQGEILPSDMRSFGSGLLGIIDNVFLFFAVKMVPVLISSIGVGGMFFTYCCVVLFNITVCFFTMPETKGLSLEEIEDFYTSMKQADVRSKAMDKV